MSKLFERKRYTSNSVILRLIAIIKIRATTDFERFPFETWKYWMHDELFCYMENTLLKFYFDD